MTWSATVPLVIELFGLKVVRAAALAGALQRRREDDHLERALAAVGSRCRRDADKVADLDVADRRLLDARHFPAVERA